MTLLVTMLTASTAWAQTAVSLQQDGSEYYVNMPTTGTNTLTLSDASVTTFKVYDDGGASGNYSDGCSGALTLTAPEGYVLQLSGSITTESWDQLTVYDGTNNTATKLLNAVSSSSRGTKTDITTVTSSGQSMRLYFSSTGSDNYAGLDLTVTLVSTSTEYNISGLGTVTGGSVAASVGNASVTTAKVNETVTLTATPSDGYLLSGISVVDGLSNAVAVDWNIWTNTATFIMPTSVVTVTPTFTNDLTSLYINMPATGTKTATIPAGVQSFKVYDDGGASGNYSGSCRSTLTLTAPAGYVLKLSGNIRTQIKWDNLTVYDGSTTSSTKLLDAVSSTSSGDQTTITTVYSSGQSMTLYFYSNSGIDYAGLDLTVTLVDANKEYDITVSNPATGGSVTADKSKAKVNETVTLTATPTDATYLLSDLTVVDANSNAVAVDWSIWSNTATFRMPGSEVTVTPTFTNDLTSLSVNMPATGSKTVTIPEGVQSFKVYDDGGAGGTGYSINTTTGGNYSNACSGTLTLTAPAGYVLKLSGNIRTQKKWDNLTVYDGSTTSATTLLNEVSSTSDGTQTAITTVTSSGQSMTLYFYSDNNYNYDGLDLTVEVLKTLELANYADNTTAINNNKGVMSKVTLSGRTLLKNGDWNTLCLPFSLTAAQIAASPLAGATIKELLSTSNLNSEGKLTLNFKDATVITAGKPYMVKWDPADNLTNPVFDNVTIDNTVNDVSFLGGSFKGTYAPLEITDANRNEVLLLATGNRLGYAKTDRTVANGKALGTCRAYFEITGAAAVRSFIMDFGDDDNTTGIIEAGANSQLSTLNSQLSTWYTLDGRRLQGKPAQKGVYIQNGKKVIIK